MGQVHAVDGRKEFTLVFPDGLNLASENFIVGTLAVAAIRSFLTLPARRVIHSPVSPSAG